MRGSVPIEALSSSGLLDSDLLEIAFASGFCMSGTYAGFIDASFLRAEGAKAIGQSPKSVRPDASAVVSWFRSLRRQASADQTFLRAYWYDSAFDPSHPNYAGQRSFFDAIALTPGLQLRLGHIAEVPSPIEQPIRRALESTAIGLDLSPSELLAEFDRRWTFRPSRQQKGVDTLIALDMVRLAGRSVCATMVLVAGDRDFAEVIRTSQDFGIRVLVATPKRASVSREVAQLADDVIDISEAEIGRMLVPRPVQTDPRAQP